jgi:hypothetical protein
MSLTSSPFFNPGTIGHSDLGFRIIEPSDYRAGTINPIHNIYFIYYKIILPTIVAGIVYFKLI